MPSDVALFWLVLAGFLVADNMLLVPSGGDYLAFGRTRHLRYVPGVRIEVLRRDLVVLNPFNPFDRAALTLRTGGELDAARLREALNRVRRALPALNRLSAMGVAYVLCLVALAGLSRSMPFLHILIGLGVVHLCAWTCGAWVVMRWRSALQLTPSRAWSLLIEGLLVPAYTVNLGKRAWYRHRLDLPAMTLGLHALKRMADGAAREQYAWRLANRVETWAEQGGAPALAYAQQARTCLQASAPSIGS